MDCSRPGWFRSLAGWRCGIAWMTPAERRRSGSSLWRYATRRSAGVGDHVKIQVAAYKYPRHVWIVDALPKDGFPRTLPQAAAAAELGARLGLTLDAVVYLYAPEPVLTQRSGSAFISPAPWTVAPRRRPTPRGHARQGDRPRDVATVSP